MSGTEARQAVRVAVAGAHERLAALLQQTAALAATKESKTTKAEAAVAALQAWRGALQALHKDVTKRASPLALAHSLSH